VRYKLKACRAKPAVKRVAVLLIVPFIVIAYLSGAISAPEPLTGDVTGNGRVDVQDVVMVMHHILEIHHLTGREAEAADVNGDGVIDVRDATGIMQFVLGLRDSFEDTFKLGSEVLLEKKRHLVEGKQVGLVTNQSGVNSRGQSTMRILHEADDVKLTALYAPEHGLDGTAKAGEYVESYIHEEMGVPVYSLYGQTRMPTGEMLKGIDILLYDIQDIGARSYTYISTLNYCMVAAEKHGLPVMVLDRPNPLGGATVDGPVMETRFISFVGVDILPMAHGMTVGELARYFNRNIGAELIVVPMEGYDRTMLYSDTGLSWVQTSPNIPDLEAAFGYMATGLGEGTGVFQADTFKWVGGKGLDKDRFAALLNDSGLSGVEFIPEQRGESGGVRLKITDPGSFNPARTGIHVLSHAFNLGNFTVPKSNDIIVMFDKIMGTAKMGEFLEQGLSPQEIEKRFAPAIEDFKQKREKYLLPRYGPAG